MQRLTKPTKATIKTAIVAYQAYFAQVAAGDMQGAIVWARMIRDRRELFHQIGLDISGPLARAEQKL